MLSAEITDFLLLRYGFAIVILLGIGICFGVATMLLAKRKGYGSGYFWSGFFFHEIGLIYVAGLPLSEKRRHGDMKKLAFLIAREMRASQARERQVGEA